MRKETLILILLGALIYLLLIIYGIKQVYTAPAIPPSKEIVITKPEDKIAIAHIEIFGPLERPQVIFDHKKHVEALKKEGKKEWETCSICHREKKEELIRVKKEDEIIKEKKIEKRDVLGFEFPKKIVKLDKEAYKKAYHDECIGCHKEKLKEKKKAGPLTCGDCHVKEKEFVKIKYPLVEFDPKLHYDHETKLKERVGEKDCGLCHHIYDLKEKKLVYQNGTEESCYYCHDLSKKKRGPELSQIVKVTEEKRLSYQKTAHERCLSCHVKINKEREVSKKEGEKVPPLECGKCHTGEYKSIADLEKVPRPDRGQKETYFINVENAKMKGVGFNHKNHEYYYKTCRACHHERLKACKDCHKLEGIPEGDWVNLVDTYHAPFSEHSCVGCHNKKKLEKDCAGCHKFIPLIDIRAKEPKKEVCDRCHTGKKEATLPPPLSTAGLDPEVVKKEIKIKVLEKEFEPADFPHRKIIDKLVSISNDHKLARYFHNDLKILCEGCHHQRKFPAEAKKDTPPSCQNCHPKYFNPVNPNKLKLQSAYHVQCISCHDNMRLEKPTHRCTDCHKEKSPRPLPTDVLGIKR
uniref:Class III cytochrome C domain-containing protein n=1 Tax=Thermodesulfobacterium geofontis TaxID=1295609 RepID=A0A7V4N3J4_9BACT